MVFKYSFVTFKKNALEELMCRESIVSRRHDLVAQSFASHLTFDFYIRASFFLIQLSKQTNYYVFTNIDGKKTSSSKRTNISISQI